MKNIRSLTSALLAISASIGIATSASAHSYTFSGSVEMTKGIDLECIVTIVKTPDHDPITNEL